MKDYVYVSVLIKEILVSRPIFDLHFYTDKCVFPRMLLDRDSKGNSWLRVSMRRFAPRKVPNCSLLKAQYRFMRLRWELNACTMSIKHSSSWFVLLIIYFTVTLQVSIGIKSECSILNPSCFFNLFLWKRFLKLFALISRVKKRFQFVI